MTQKKKTDFKIVTPPDDLSEVRAKTKKIHREKLKKIVVPVILIALAVSGTYLMLTNKAYSEAGTAVRYSTDSSDTSNYAHFANGIVRYNRDGVVFLNKKNEEKWIQSTQLKNPIIEVKEKAFAVGDIGGNNDSLALAAGIMQSGALLTVLLALSTLTTGILQGLGEMQAPLVHAATAVAIHLGFLVLFVVKFKWNIYGVVYANIIFGLIICLLNARSIRKKLHYRQEIKKTFLVPVIAAGVMGIAAYLVHRVFNLFAGNTISTILAVCVGAVVYGICLVKLGGILEREIRRLPKGDLLADLLIRLNIL